MVSWQQDKATRPCRGIEFRFPPIISASDKLLSTTLPETSKPKHLGLRKTQEKCICGEKTLSWQRANMLSALKDQVLVVV